MQHNEFNKIGDNCEDHNLCLKCSREWQWSYFSRAFYLKKLAKIWEFSGLFGLSFLVFIWRFLCKHIRSWYSIMIAIQLIFFSQGCHKHERYRIFLLKDFASSYSDCLDWFFLWDSFSWYSYIFDIYFLFLTVLWTFNSARSLWALVLERGYVFEYFFWILIHQVLKLGQLIDNNQEQYLWEIFWTTWRTRAKFKALFNIPTYSNYSKTN